MTLSLSERLEVLRDEALNCAEYGVDAPGSEIFDAVMSHLTDDDTDTDPDLDLSLHDALSRRLAWGEDPSAIIVDCDGVCKRLLAATHRSFPDPEVATRIAGIITEVACAASRHIARVACQRAGKERAQQRREKMVQRQLSAALEQQEELIRSLSTQLKV